MNHIFTHAENYSAAQNTANTYETRGLRLIDWHPHPHGGLILHFTAPAPAETAEKPAAPRRKTRRPQP